MGLVERLLLSQNEPARRAQIEKVINDAAARVRHLSGVLGEWRLEEMSPAQTANLLGMLEQLQRRTESAVEGLGLSPAKPSPRCLVLPDDEVPVPASPACASPVASPRPRRKAGRPSASPSERAPMTGDRALAHQLRVSRQASPTRAR